MPFLPCQSCGNWTEIVFDKKRGGGGGDGTCDFKSGSFPGAQREVDPCCQSPCGSLCCDLPASQVGGHQGGGARRVNTHTGSLQAECVRNAACCHAGCTSCVCHAKLRQYWAVSKQLSSLLVCLRLMHGVLLCICRVGWQETESTKVQLLLCSGCELFFHCGNSQLDAQKGTSIFGFQTLNKSKFSNSKTV